MCRNRGGVSLNSDVECHVALREYSVAKVRSAGK